MKRSRLKRNAYATLTTRGKIWKTACQIDPQTVYMYVHNAHTLEQLAK